jgi:cobaltochelatase CobN
VGIIFYRAHWLSGNTGFIDALVAALEARGMDVLPVFTSSLRVSASTGAALPPALRISPRAGSICIINTTSFAMGEITAGGVTPAGWSVSVLEQLDRPVLQAITSGMTQAQWQHSTRGMNPLDTAMNVALPEFDGRIIGVPLSFKPEDRPVRLPGHCRTACAASPAGAAPGALRTPQCAQAHRLHLHQFQQQGLADRQCRGAGCAESLMAVLRRCRPMATASATCRTAARR